MLWVLLALMATFLWALNNIIDKVLRTKYLKHSTALTASFGIFGIIFSAILFAFAGIPSLPFVYFIAALLSGFFLIFGVIFYVKALSVEEASRVIPLWHLIPIFTLILAVIFLNEILAPLKYIAFASILAGGIIISAKLEGKVFNLSPALVFMLISSFLVSISDVLLKFAYTTSIFWQTFFVFYFGASLSSLSLFILPNVRKNTLNAFKSHKYVFAFILFLSGLFGSLGQILFNGAVLKGPITLVSVFVSFQSLFVLLIATFLSIKFPLFIKEAIDIKTIGIKLVAIALMTVGLYLLVL